MYTKENARKKIESLVDRRRSSILDSQGLGVTIGFQDSGDSWVFGADKEDSLFHTASVGKLFTTALIAMLIDRGKITLETPISSILSSTVLSQLFTYRGKDYQAEVRVGHLLNHTSGVGDYFSGKSTKGITVEELLVRDPKHFWTPQELVHWTRDFQKPSSRPGERCRYSDTGFVLLGLLLEEIYQEPFHKVLEKEIFHPLGMKNSFMPYRSSAGSIENLRPVWISNTDVSTFPSISADWAGGGVVTNAVDLLRFAQGLFEGELVSESTRKTLEQFSWTFRPGMAYGYGLMEMQFEKFFPLLRGLPRLQGHSGITGTHLYYDRTRRRSFVISFGSTKRMVDSVKILIELVQILHKTQFG